MPVSCDISLGRLLPCKNGVGGISGLFVINAGVIVPVYDTANTEVVKDLGAGVTAHYYEIKSASNLIQTLNSSSDNGTTSIDQAITALLQKIEYSTNKELKLLAYGRPVIVVQFKSGQSFICGIEFGCSLETGVSDSGILLNDFNGYTLTITANELAYANSCAEATTYNPAATAGTTGPFQAFATPVTIVDGLDISPTPPTITP